MSLLIQSFEAFQAKRYLAVPGLLNQALEVARENGDKTTEGLILHVQSQLFLKLGAKERSEALAAQGTAILDAVQNREEVALVYLILGWAHRKVGGNAEAEKEFNRALAMARALRSKRVEALAATSLGWLYSQTGEFQKWVAFSDIGIESARVAGDTAGEAWALLCKSLFYANGSNSQQGEVLHLRALERIRVPRAKVQESPLLENVKSLLYDKLIEVKILAMLGLASNGSGRLQEAAGYFEQSAKLALASGADFYAVDPLMHLANINSQLKQDEQQIKNLQQALAISERSGNAFSESGIWLLLGHTYARNGDLQKALEAYKRSVQKGNDINRPRPDSVLELARTETALGLFTEAAQHWEEGLEQIEAVRNSLGTLSEAKQAYLANWMYYYKEYIAFLENRDQTDKAFSWIERTRARALLDLMQNGKANLDRGLSPDEKKKLDELRSRADEWNRRLIAQSLRGGADAGSTADIKASLTQSERELQDYNDTLLARYPSLAQRRVTHTVSSDDLAEVLPDDTALLSYVVAEPQPGARTSLYCITREQGKAVVKRYTIDVPRDELNELLDDFNDACADPKKNFRSKARELHTLLVAPAATQIAGKKRLVFCPDGPLWGLPFQALSEKKANGDQFLLENYEISYSYSATALQTTLSAQRTAPKKWNGELLVYANPDFGGADRLALKPPADKPAAPTGGTPRPIGADARAITADSRAITADSRAITADSRAITADSRAITADSRAVVGRGGEIVPLPGTQVEADALSKSFPSARVATGALAQESDVKANGGQYRYLHFATHGLFNDTSPLLSSVVLAQPAKGSSEDGFLTAREIFDLDWDVDLVVLSACNTGRGQKRSGEGVVGLTWALFAAGAPSQVVSQWAVNDSSTALLMKNFYGELEKKRPRAEALRTASLALLRDGEHAHPYYWAPFILMGDWR
jgi:CHAT domain-containing protein/tetratricopeptide (TPR) repeat protein